MNLLNNQTNLIRSRSRSRDTIWFIFSIYSREKNGVYNWKKLKTLSFNLPVDEQIIIWYYKQALKLMTIECMIHVNIALRIYEKIPIKMLT